MSVIAVVFDEPNLEEMEGWSHWIADSLKQDLKTFYVSNESINDSRTGIHCLDIENAFSLNILNNLNKCG